MKNLKDFIITNKANFDNYNLSLSMQDFIDFEPTFKSKKEYLSKFGDYSYYEFEDFADYFECACGYDCGYYIKNDNYYLGFTFDVYSEDARLYVSDLCGDGFLIMCLPFPCYADLKSNLDKLELLALDIFYAFNC